ncbi:hypothetical protein MD484_g1613, partial [Candolleomyces efflorescens]
MSPPFGFLWNVAFWPDTPPSSPHQRLTRPADRSAISASSCCVSGEDDLSEHEKCLSNIRRKDPRYLWHDGPLGASGKRYPARAMCDTYIDAQQQTNMKNLLLEAPWNIDASVSFADPQDATEKWEFRSRDGTASNGTWTRRSSVGILCDFNSIVLSAADVCLRGPGSSYSYNYEPTSVSLIGMSSLPGQPAVASNILMMDGNEANRAYLMFRTLPGFEQVPSASSTPGSIYGAHLSLPFCSDPTRGSQRRFVLITSPKGENEGRQRFRFLLSEAVPTPGGETLEVLLVSGVSDSEFGITVAFNYDGCIMPRHRSRLDIPGELSLIHFLLLCVQDQCYRVHCYD